MEVRDRGRIGSVAVITAVGVNADGWREVLAVDIGASEGGRVDLDGVPRQADSRGLPGQARPLDANEGLKAAATKVLSAAWQRGWPA
ncbi:transposase [Mesorhizobium sp. M0166]|uniref:transposase n=1 Tax=Mesorhizobium sp. M0166 TaxID=2956902 RepID=UPI00333D5A57